MTTPPLPPAAKAMNFVGSAAVGAQKTVLITGVSRGLGKALALELAKRGHTVIGCSRSQDNLSALQSELSSASASSASSDASKSTNEHLVMNVDVVISFAFIEFRFCMRLIDFGADITVFDAGV